MFIDVFSGNQARTGREITLRDVHFLAECKDLLEQFHVSWVVFILREELDIAADDIGSAAFDQWPEGVRNPAFVGDTIGIGKCDDLALGDIDAVVPCHAATALPLDREPNMGKIGHDVVKRLGRVVVDDNDFVAVRRIVLIAQGIEAYP